MAAVVEMIAAGQEAAEVSAAAAKAADSTLKSATDDPVLREALWLLASLPLAARSPEFRDQLDALGLSKNAGTDIFSFSGALASRLDEVSRVGDKRTDLGEMAQLALVESFSAAIDSQLSTLFTAEPADFRQALGRLSSGDQFAEMARDFFARLSHRILDGYLSRELAAHIGDENSIRLLLCIAARRR